MAALEEPKKPQNPYWIFLSENRDAITKEAGSGKAGAVAKVAGAKWKNMDEKEKKSYEQKAEKLRKEYEAALEKFKAGGGVVGKRRLEKAAAKKEKDGKRARKAAKDPNRPKKPQSAYWLWLSDNRPAFMKETNGKVTEVSKLGGERWKKLSDKDKAPYEKKAAELKAKHTKDMEEYKKTAGAAADDGDDDDEEEGGEEEN